MVGGTGSGASTFRRRDTILRLFRAREAAVAGVPVVRPRHGHARVFNATVQGRPHAFTDFVAGAGDVRYRLRDSNAERDLVLTRIEATVRSRSTTRTSRSCWTMLHKLAATEIAATPCQLGTGLAGRRFSLSRNYTLAIRNGTPSRSRLW